MSNLHCHFSAALLVIFGGPVQVGLSGDEMTIALPSTSKRGLSGLLGRKRQSVDTSASKTARKQLKPQEVAKLFTQDPESVKAVRPAKLNDAEKQDRARLNSLRGALYSED